MKSSLPKNRFLAPSVAVFFCLHAVGVANAAAPADDYLHFDPEETKLLTELAARIA